MEQASLRPLFEQSARQGVIYGILFTVMSGCLLFSLEVPGLSIVLLVLASVSLMYLPVSLSAVVARQPAYRTFPALWMSGIVQYICGALICSLATAVFLTIIQPDFLHGYVKVLIEQLMAVEQTQPVDVDSLVTPTPMQFVGSMFWATSFFGAVTSLLMGLVLPRSSFFRRLIARSQSKIFNP